MPATRTASAWLTRVRGKGRPLYAAIVDALEDAIREDELQPGDRLPPQRAVAQALGIDLTTVTRAYAAARTLGIIEGAVGKGTFVRLRPVSEDAGLVDLSMNLPPPPDGLSLGALLEETITDVLRRADPNVLMSYHPDFGAPSQRRAAADWLRPCLGETAPDRILISPGAQATFAAAFSTFCRRGDAVVSTPLTYPGFRAVAGQLGLRVIPCPVDEDGPLPDALQAICEHERPAAIYLNPTIQNPTARTCPERRRRELARVIGAAGVWLVEDDPYSRILEAPPPAISSMLQDRFVYVATLAKTLSPGLRIAYVVCASPRDREQMAVALRAMAQMPAPLMAAVVTTWMREGTADALLKAVRSEAKARRALAAQMLPGGFGPEASLHVWLPLPESASVESLRLAAQGRGLAIVTHDEFAIAPEAGRGMRVCLGGPGRRAVLAGALTTLADLLATGPASPRAVV